MARVIREIFVHCTATAEGKDWKAADIRKWHISPPNNWSDIGYHYVIDLDGSVEKGRDEDKVGAHVSGHNSYSIGVVYVGGLAKDGKTAKDTRTPEQKVALKAVLKMLKIKYPNAVIYGHRNFANKACPCFDAKKEYENI